MCSIDETKKVLNEEFHKDGGMRDSIIEDFKDEINRIAIRGLIIFGVTIITTVVSFTTYIVSIDNQVQEHEKFISSGDRFTQLDGEILKQQISNTDEKINELKETIIRLDERLRNKGI